MGTIREMRAEVARLTPLIEAARENEVPKLLAAFRQEVEAYKITEAELLKALGFVKPKRKASPAKYYDPSTGNAWSGRGKLPKWLVGKNLDDYLIREAPQAWWPEERKTSEPKQRRKAA